MFDFRLRVFYSVAQRLSFTRAGEELFITQPAVTRHIHELEDYFRLKLFERNGNRVSLTAAGQVLLAQTEKLFAVYNDLELEMTGLTLNRKGRLRIGASTTVAQYVLPPVLAGFRQKYPGIRISLRSENSEEIGAALLDGNIDFGIIEGRAHHKSIQYRPFLKDEIVLVSSNAHPMAHRNTLRTEELAKIPLLFREAGSGTLEVIHYALKKAGLKLSDLQIEMELNSTEAIKNYLKNSACMAFVSLLAAKPEIERGELRRMPVKGLQIVRPFNIITAMGDPAELAKLFIRFALSHNYR